VGHAVSLRNRSRTDRADGRELPDRPTLEHHAPLPDSRHWAAEGGIYGRLALARSREAAAKSFEGMPGRRSENIRRSCEILPRFLRRLRFDAGGDPRGARLRRRENECRYRHAIRIHTRGRRQMFKNDERRAESRRRSRQQESL
jgi:hypothetical protein